MTTIRIPTPLRRFAGDQPSIEVEADTVDDALSALVREHSALRTHLFDETGSLRNFVNVYVNEADIRSLDGGATPVRPADTLVIVPSIAGGNSQAITGPAPARSSMLGARFAAALPHDARRQ